MVTELDRRAELIQNDKETLALGRETRNKCYGKICNLKSDVLTFPDNHTFKLQLTVRQKELEELDKKIQFYVVDIHNAEKLLKRDIKLAYEASRPITIHNRELKKDATNHMKPYTDEEIEEVFLYRF